MDTTSASKFLSLVLRHKPETIGISLDEHGWAEVDRLIAGIDKTTVPVDVQLERAGPPEFLWHGTGEKYVASIEKAGLIPKSCLYVHLSSSPKAAREVGQRHGKPVVFRVLAGRMQEEGCPFYLSKNGVWLTEKVPAKYLERAENT